MQHIICQQEKGKNMKIIKKSLDDLENLLTFVKTDINRLSDEEFHDFIGDYVHLFISDDSNTPFQDFMKKHYSIVKNILHANDSKKYDDLKSIMKAVQNHLRATMDTFRHILDKGSIQKVWESQGQVRLYYDPEANIFVEEFGPEKLPDYEKFDLELECQLIENQFFKTIRFLAVNESKGKFRVCKKCDTPFFQATNRTKLFCSVKCAKAAAQANYVKKKS